MGLSIQQRKFTYHVACLIQYAYDICGIEMTMGEAHRTGSQILLNYFGYKIVRVGRFGIKLEKTKRLSRTLRSLHADRLAIDFNFSLYAGNILNNVYCRFVIYIIYDNKCIDDKII